MVSPLHFARFEFKYVLPLKKRDLIESELKNFLQYDPFVEDRLDKKYVVRSLYFDSPEYSAFYDKVDGLHSRSKFRLRTYALNEKEGAPIYLEIKGRHNNLVYKTRIPVDMSGVDLTALSDDALSAAIIECAPYSPIIEQFKYDRIRKSIAPVALIDYQRRPYISKYDPTFRITFDEELTATSTGGIYTGSHTTPRRIVPGYTVLEVKFRYHMPSWFHRIIQTHELRRVSISKICSGMEALGLAFDN
jgi:hypothetical protein